MIRRVGFTTRATCLLAAGLTAVVCGILFGEVDLVRAGVFAAAVPVVAALIVHRSRVRIANRRRIEPTEAQAGQPVTVHLTISNRSVLPTGALMLEDRLPDRVLGRARFVVDPLAGRETRPVSYRMPSLARGRYRVGPLRLRISDPFRLIELSRSFAVTDEFVIGPVVDELPTLEPPRSDDVGENTGSRSVGTHGADDQSTREYRTGDDLRKIHWRSSARMGALMVRQEERPWQGHTTVLLDSRTAAHVQGPDALRVGVDPRLTNSFEWAVSATASIGSHLLARGRRVNLVTDLSGGHPQDRSAPRSGGADPLLGFTGSGLAALPLGDPRRLAGYLADIRESAGSDLSPAGGALRAAGRDSTIIAVLGRVGPDALRQLAEGHARGRSSPAFAVLLDVDSWGRPLPDDDFSAGRDEGDASEPRLAASAAVLRNAGWRVAVARQGEATAQIWRRLLATANTEAGTVARA